MGKTALIVGSTGAIGRQLMPLLSASPEFAKLIVLHHRATSYASAPKVEEQVADLTRLPNLGPMPGIAVVFCCIGTTQKRAGSTEAFQKVDRDIPVALAERAARSGTAVFVGISSIGASTRAPSVYLRTKGEMEDGVAAAGIPSVYLLRPSLLAGDRDEYRLKEQIGNAVLGVAGPLLIGPLRKYRAIKTKTVAKAMLACARTGAPGVHILESDQIQDLGA